MVYHIGMIKCILSISKLIDNHSRNYGSVLYTIRAIILDGSSCLSSTLIPASADALLRLWEISFQSTDHATHWHSRRILPSILIPVSREQATRFDPRVTPALSLLISSTYIVPRLYPLPLSYSRVAFPPSRNISNALFSPSFRFRLFL